MRDALRSSHAARAARDGLEAVRRGAVPVYGLCAAVAIAVPLLVEARTGTSDVGLPVALGTYLVAVRAPQGTYGQKARVLALVVMVIGVGSLIGGLLHGHRWIIVAVLPPLVMVGSMVSRIGPTLALATMLSTIRSPVHGALPNCAFMVSGALVMSALVLAPWPGRRLKPLLEAMSDAVEAVAAALDVVLSLAGDDEWEGRRRAAADVLNTAHTTYGLYHSSSDDERPARLIRTLVNIMFETVALRALIEAAEARSLDTKVKNEIKNAAVALAARLRRLGEAIEAAGGPGARIRSDGGTADRTVNDPAAMTRLGEQVDKARRAAFESDENEDLLDVVLLGQARRSLRRIDGLVHSAERIVAAGITVRVSVPGLLPGSPRSLWNRSVAAVTGKAGALRLALRAGVAVAAATAIWAGFAIPRGNWLVIAVLLCVRGTYGETMERVLARIGGITAGGIVAAVLLTTVRGQTELALVIFACAFVGFTLRAVSYALWMAIASPLVLLLIDFGTTTSWTQSLLRSGLNVAGGLLALLAARLLWPSTGTRGLPAMLARLVAAQAALIRAVISRDDLGRALERARDAAADLTDLTTRMAQEPSPDLDLVGSLRDATTAAFRIRDNVIVVMGISQAEEGEMGPVNGALQRIADHLDEVADALKAGDTSMPELDTGDLLDDVDGYLSSLAGRRRTEVASGTDPQERTRLRQDLRSVAAVRHALRGLCEDTRQLRAALCR